MATNTIVCPECQAPAVAGRYACVRCGALLASIVVTPRLYEREVREVAPTPVAVVGPAEAPADVAPPPAAVSAAALAQEIGREVRVSERPRRTPKAPAWTHALDAEPVESAPSADEHWDDQAATDEGRIAAASGEPSILKGVVAEVARRVNGSAPASANGAAVAKGAAPAPANGVTAAKVPPPASGATAAKAPSPARSKSAPAAAAKAVVAKVRRRSTQDQAALASIAPLATPQPVAEPGPEWPAEPAPTPVVATAKRQFGQPLQWATAAPSEPVPAVRSEPVAAPLEPVAAPRVEPAARDQAVPGWPPPGDRGPLAEPAQRVPAGVYLPPSAVLPSGENLPAAVAQNGRPAQPAASPSAGSDTPPRASAADRLAKLDLPADTPRRVVAIGAVVAALGFLLPWTSSLANNDVLGDYWVRWGMAGPGAWLVVAMLIALAGLTLAGGRFATTSVGLPGFAMAMLLLGLTWSYFFGFPGRAVGLWVVLGGVILLAVGGLLDMRAGRHADEQPTV